MKPTNKMFIWQSVTIIFFFPTFYSKLYESNLRVLSLLYKKKYLCIILFRHAFIARFQVFNILEYIRTHWTTVSDSYTISLLVLTFFKLINSHNRCREIGSENVGKMETEIFLGKFRYSFCEFTAEIRLSGLSDALASQYVR